MWVDMSKCSCGTSPLSLFLSLYCLFTCLVFFSVLNDCCSVRNVVGAANLTMCTVCDCEVCSMTHGNYNLTKWLKIFWPLQLTFLTEYKLKYYLDIYSAQGFLSRYGQGRFSDLLSKLDSVLHPNLINSSQSWNSIPDCFGC